MRIIDLTHTLDNDCMTCGTKWHETVSVTPLGTISEVGRNTHKIVLGSHSGTHMDAPLHFLQQGYGIDYVALETVCGPIDVVDFTYKKKDDIILREELLSIKISERMLFRFDWFKKWKSPEFYQGFPHFSVEAARYLVENGLKVMALDTPSPDSGNAIGLAEDSPVHKVLLQANVVIIEYLTDTDKLDGEKKNCLYALPLKIKDCDGAPARVIVVESD